MERMRLTGEKIPNNIAMDSVRARRPFEVLLRSGYSCGRFI